MTAHTTFHLGLTPIRDHVFSSDRRTLAVTRDSYVDIFNVSTSPPILIATLAHHEKPVTSVDICSDGSGRILTCSQDRNALVWLPVLDGSYTQTLVLLRISRAATVCQWSPNGMKFAVGLADRIIAVCYYEEENDWWVSKHLKKPFRLTVTSILWHHNNVLLACGLTDGHTRVLSAYIKGVDEKPAPTRWGSKLPFQTLCGDYSTNTGAWIHSVSFSPSGDILAYALHDAELHVVYAGLEGQPPRAFFQVTTNHLPFNLLVFQLECRIIVAGHDGILIVFEGSEAGWKEMRVVGSANNGAVAISVAADCGDDDEISSHQALNMFKQMDLKGRVNKSSISTAPNSPTTILAIKNLNSNEISASTIDGKVTVYKV